MIIIAEYGLPSKLMSDAGTNFVSGILQAPKHTPCCIILWQPSKQQTSGGVHIFFKVNHEEMFWN